MAASTRAIPVRTSRAWALVAALVTIFAWASAFPLIRVALQHLEPLPLAAARFFLAAIVVTLWISVARPRRPSLRDTGIFIACGLIGIGFYNALLNTGQQTVAAGAASFLINTGPIITAALASLLHRESFGPAAWFGSFVALAGVTLIALGQTGGVSLGHGASLIIGAAFCHAIYFIIQRPLVPHYGALACAAYTIIAGAIALAPWLPDAYASLSAVGYRSAALWPLLLLALVPSVIGYAAWNFALDGFGAARAANFLYLVPPVAVTLALVLANEVPSWRTIVGGAIAIAGVAIVNRRGHVSSLK